MLLIEVADFGESRFSLQLHAVKKVSNFPVPSRNVTNQTLLGQENIITLFPVRDSLFSDIPAGDGKITNLFYSVAPSASEKNYHDMCIVHAVLYILSSVAGSRSRTRRPT